MSCEIISQLENIVIYYYVDVLKPTCNYVYERQIVDASIARLCSTVSDVSLCVNTVWLLNLPLQ